VPIPIRLVAVRLGAAGGNADRPPPLVERVENVGVAEVDLDRNSGRCP
jgi:hypothetical protein